MTPREMEVAALEETERDQARAVESCQSAIRSARLRGTTPAEREVRSLHWAIQRRERTSAYLARLRAISEAEYDRCPPTLPPDPAVGAGPEARGTGSPDRGSESVPCRA